MSRGAQSHRLLVTVLFAVVVLTADRDAVAQGSTPADAAKIVLSDGTVGLSSELVSATFLAPTVILAHVLATADIPSGPRAGKIQFRFTHVVVNENGLWKMRSSSTTLVQPRPPAK